uniref:pyridoxal phosphate-dependent decarboxylase family protein n=1 Tax=uncultured Altererythrobacter sp. TaxID=500840 RepID=UPI00260F24B6|nr:pyridoxal-dependent decarboxylase [uncultured Altererythrobacter sp.]
MSFPLQSASDVARRASDATLDFLASLPERPVAMPGARDWAADALDIPLPESQGEALDTLERIITASEKSVVASAGGRFFGMVVGGSLPAAVGARILNAGWDQLATSDETSPLANVAEQVASHWVLDVLGLPSQSSVGFVTGASLANLQSLAVARAALLRRSGWDMAERGLNGAPPIRIVTSAAIHPTVRKMMHVLGFGNADITAVPCDEEGRVLPDAMPAVDEHTIVVLQAGCVNTGASDPFHTIADHIEGTGAWLHIDGAFGLWAAASPKLSAQVAGAERADSWAVDAHKWLNTPYDCGMAVCAHPEEVKNLLAFDAPYVPNISGLPQKDMVLELSRAARGIEVWAALHSLGRQGTADLIERCCEHARTFAEGLETQGFTILNEVVQNQVVATIDGHEEHMVALAKHVQMSGECWFGNTVWQGRMAIRISVSNWQTNVDDVRRSLAAIESAVRELALV